jgi:hypothetical protein
VGNATILLSVVNSPIAACCQQDGCFVRVTCLVNFSGLISIPNYGPTTLQVGFYIKLPQTTVAMTNGHNATHNLTTWHGVTRKEVRNLILKPCLQDGPIVLCPTNFNLGDANIDTAAIRESIQAKILKLGFCQICSSIFTQLCPGYSDQPHAVLEHICQTSTGPDG